jgi:hypothetical protein
LIYRQTGDAQGDFIRTSDGLANSQRILTAQIENVKTSIGTALLPVATELFQFIGSQLIPLMTRFSDSFSKEAAPAIDGLRKVVVDFVLPALKNLWGFITEFIIPTIRNILSPVIDILRAGFQFLSDKVRENQAGFEVFFGVIQRVWQFIRDYLSPIIGGVLTTVLNLVFRAIGHIVDSFGKFFEMVGKVARFLGIDLDFSLEKSADKVNNLDSGIVDAYRSFQEQSRTVNQQVIPGLAALDVANEQSTGKINKVTDSAKKATAALKALAAAQGAAGVGGGGGGGGGGSNRLTGVASKAQLIGDFGGLLGGFNLSPSDPYHGFGKGDKLETFERNNTNVTINVNGTVLDPEGTARAIQDVLQNSAGRAGNLPLGALLGIE